MPKDLIIAAIRLLLKKAILELIFKNYRPVSNLLFLGKVIAKVVMAHLLDHLKVMISSQLTISSILLKYLF